MQTRREYAASLGLAIAGARGKFSNEAKAAIAKAEAEGTVFADSPSNKPAPVEAQDKPEVKRDPRVADYLFPSDFRYPEAEYKALDSVGGKTYGMRECCNTCRVSLTNHTCDTPTIHGNIVVTIERR